MHTMHKSNNKRWIEDCVLISIAYKWFNLAAAQGNTQAIESRDRLIAVMTPSQIEAGQRLSRSFKPKK